MANNGSEKLTMVDTDHDEPEEKEDKEPAGIIHVLKGQPILSPLLLCIPLGFVSYWCNWSKPWIFLCNFFSILPMAWLIGKTTEDLASHTGEIAGGLINATFGNVVEMLLCVAGIRQNQLAVVKCTLVGSILSNLLLVMGTSFAWGGYWYHTQKFSSAGAGAHTSLMLLSVLALTLPTTYDTIIQNNMSILGISRGCSLMLLFVYLQYLYFELQTHKDLFEDSSSDKGDDDDDPDLVAPVAVTILGICTILTACCSEYLIASIEGTIESWNISKEFIGIIILPIIGNAAEHYTAIVVAGRNKMDLSLGVAVGSSCQMAMLVTPFCVLVGWGFGVDMDLDFHPFQVVVLMLSVLIVANVINDGQSNWLEGSMLITAYALIATIYGLQESVDPSTINTPR